MTMTGFLMVFSGNANLSKKGQTAKRRGLVCFSLISYICTESKTNQNPLPDT